MNSANVTGVLGFLLASLTTIPLSAQERLAMDVEAGRVIIEGVEYDFSRIAAVDHERRIVYVVDAVEPLGVMALSIEDGSRIAIYGGTRGDGPGELRSLRSVSLSPEGVLVSGGGAINHWGREGNFIGSWRPDLSAASRVVGQCMVHGQLVVPSMMGAVRRKPDGSWELLGEPSGIPTVPCLATEPDSWSWSFHGLPGARLSGRRSIRRQDATRSSHRPTR